MNVTKVLAVLALAFAPALYGQMFYVGAYTDVAGSKGPESKGIVAFRFNAANGKLTPLGLMAETPNPSFLALSANGNFLYAVNEMISRAARRGRSAHSPSTAARAN